MGNRKFGITGLYLFFLYLIPNIHCGYSLKPPRRGDCTCTDNQCFRKYIINIFKDFFLQVLHLKKNICKLHGQVLVMICSEPLHVKTKNFVSDHVR